MARKKTIKQIAAKIKSLKKQIAKLEKAEKKRKKYYYSKKRKKG